MGTIMQYQVPQSLDRVSIKERNWRWESRNNNVPNRASSIMGRKQSQRKTLQPQNTCPAQDTDQINDKRLHPRRKQKPSSPLCKSNTTKHSLQEASDSKSHLAPPTGKKGPPKIESGHKRQKQAALLNTHEPGLPDTMNTRTPNQESVDYAVDYYSDVSESERGPVPPFATHNPPLLNLRPEAIDPDVVDGNDSVVCSRGRRPKGQRHHSGFPDFLPPPFNSWSLGQLAVCCHGDGAPRPGPAGPLEKYLERLLRLEWDQIQTVREEGGRWSGSEAHPGPSSSCLSSPKGIPQCQRAFPLTLLSSLANHPALLSGCACPLCLRLRCSTTGRHPSRPFHGPASLPKRSYSETRALPEDRAKRFHSPVRANTHLRRMQASGNIRNPVPAGAPTTQPQHTARDRADAAGVWCGDHRATSVRRRRSGSERRRSETGRRRDGSEKRRSGSECRRGGAERGRLMELREEEIKPDAVTAIMDNLPGSKKSPPSKHVEFVK